MEIIEKLTEMIDEELDDAEKYARCALDQKQKADYPSLAETFYKLSEEEMKHMAMLHDQVTAIIEDYRKKNGEPPEAMMTVYKILHKRHISHAMEVRALQSAYKNPNAI